MKLYTFFRASAPYRMRIALNLKGLKVNHQGPPPQIPKPYRMPQQVPAING